MLLWIYDQINAAFFQNLSNITDPKLFPIPWWCSCYRSQQDREKDSSEEKASKAVRSRTPVSSKQQTQSNRRSVWGGRRRCFIRNLKPLVSLCWTQPLKSSGKGCGEFMRLTHGQTSINFINASQTTPFRSLVKLSVEQQVRDEQTYWWIAKPFQICFLKKCTSVCLIWVICILHNLKGSARTRLWLINQTMTNPFLVHQS